MHLWYLILRSWKLPVKYELGSHNYVLLSEEEIDEIIPKNNQEENNNENH